VTSRSLSSEPTSSRLEGPRQDIEPSGETYPVTVGLRLDGSVDHGTAFGIELTYSVGGRKRRVKLPTGLMVVSKSVYSTCGKADAALGHPAP